MVESTQSNYDDPVYAKFKNVLKGAEIGNVVTRFPPEPSGFLHIGHVKAAMLNYHYAKMYKGKMILRFDDTNPTNEKDEFVENIIRDLKTLEITADRVSFTSDYFDETEKYMRKMIELGLAYADDTPAEQMKDERDKGIESKYRTATIEENLQRFQEMLETRQREAALKAKKPEAAKQQKGDGKKKPDEVPAQEEEKKSTHQEIQHVDSSIIDPVIAETKSQVHVNQKGEEEKMKVEKSAATAKKEKKAAKEAQAAASEKKSDWCIRAKMNMQNKVKCLRDPVFYRVKRDPHHKTGEKYSAYPTYDFACPIVDALEDVTHCLRTIEYHDRNELYHWVQQVLGLKKITIYDYSRLNLVSTVLSKRSLKWFVESGHAEGWYDPRFPTVQGIMRRGLTVEALKLFMLEQGPSKNTNLMEWDKLWALNKQVIDPVAPRYSAIVKDTAVKFILENVEDQIEAKSVPLHPKNEALGSKSLIYGKSCWIEKDDAESIQEGEKIALRSYGKVFVTKKVEENGKTVIYGQLDREDQDFKKAKIVTWICADDSVTCDITLKEFDHLITKKKVEENDDVKDIVNKDSKAVYTAIGEGFMRNLKKGDFIQLERRGFFYVDSAAVSGSPLTLHYIPDGKLNPMSKLSHKFDVAELQKGKDVNKVLANSSEAEKAKADGNVDGEAKPLSKKEAKKAAKKEQKKATKGVKKDGEEATGSDQQPPAGDQVQ